MENRNVVKLFVIRPDRRGQILLLNGERCDLVDGRVHVDV